MVCWSDGPEGSPLWWLARSPSPRQPPSVPAPAPPLRARWHTGQAVEGGEAAAGALQHGRRIERTKGVGGGVPPLPCHATGTWSPVAGPHIAVSRGAG